MCFPQCLVMPLAKHAHRAFSTVWLFACDNVLTPILAHVVVWLEDKQWLNNPKQQCLDRLRNTMASAEDYATWSQCAERANRMNGFDEWRFNDDDADFDWKAMRCADPFIANVTYPLKTRNKKCEKKNLFLQS